MNTYNGYRNCDKEQMTTMNRVLSAYINRSERVRNILRNDLKAQTMTEYALILAAVATVAYITYQVMGQDIGSMVNTIDNGLATA
jgi:Flp pilus assembly pilin Flp